MPDRPTMPLIEEPEVLVGSSMIIMCHGERMRWCGGKVDSHGEPGEGYELSGASYGCVSCRRIVTLTMVTPC